jgi:hypothetical protein
MFNKNAENRGKQEEREDEGRKDKRAFPEDSQIGNERGVG